ncbi:hypothetical protein DKX38_027003 [Salix brachista]|uniref:RNase H type-1 domain-containing protein n=1 Tax=Salix brachista TaxID=2182728 RepID=A0A5N5JG74_9ROSI|nr:hypothetical protein DKX38_027003 [Salix brachista]
MGNSKVLRSMKRQCEWVVSAEETLKGKTRIIVITNPSNEEDEDEIMCLTSNHITIEEDDNDKFVVEEDVEEAPSSLESENKPTMDELKEVNLGTVENPRPTFINANLSLEEEANYMELLMVLPFSFSLTKFCSNNMTEYQALILGLEMTMNIKMSRLKVFGDSQLVIRQLLSLYKVRKPEFIPYHKYALKMITSLDCVTLEHVPRKENKQADALANLASTLASCSEEIKVLVCQRWVVPPLSHDIEEKEQVGVVSVYEIEREDSRQPLIDYLRHGKLPKDLRHKTEVRRRASPFIYF